MGDRSLRNCDGSCLQNKNEYYNDRRTDSCKLTAAFWVLGKIFILRDKATNPLCFLNFAKQHIFSLQMHITLSSADTFGFLPVLVQLCKLISITFTYQYSVIYIKLSLLNSNKPEFSCRALTNWVKCKCKSPKDTNNPTLRRFHRVSCTFSITEYSARWQFYWLHVMTLFLQSSHHSVYFKLVWFLFISLNIFQVWIWKPYFGPAFLKSNSRGRLCQTALLRSKPVRIINIIILIILSHVVVGWNERHPADHGPHRFLPDFHLDVRAILGEFWIYVTHSNVLFEAGGWTAASHLTCLKI